MNPDRHSKCNPSEHTLKNGSVIITRSLCAADAEQALAHRVRVCGESDNLSRYPDEIRMTLEGECIFLQRQEESEKGVMLGAFADGKLLAMASVQPISETHERYRLRGGFGISVLQDYWNQGIASLLIPRVLECARRAKYEQIELEVLAENAKAVSLYQKYGFREYGRRPHGFKMRDGTYRDELLMLHQL